MLEIQCGIVLSSIVFVDTQIHLLGNCSLKPSEKGMNKRMESSILKERATFALNAILSEDKVDYRAMSRSKICFLIQDNHPDIQKEIALLLQNDWKDIKRYDTCNSVKQFLIRFRFRISNTKAEFVVSDEVVESIVDLMLPDIIAFFESEEGKKEFEEWKEKNNTKNI